MNKKFLYGIGGILVVIIIAILLSQIVRTKSIMRGVANDLNNPNSGGIVGTINDIDKHFIEQMIPHHDGAIAMANIALLNASHSEIKMLAKAIIETQNGEIKEMRNWYKEWFGVDVSAVDTGMIGGGMMAQSGMHMGGQEDIQTLKNATNFDKAFIEGMIPHHQLAIMMAQMLRSGTNKPEMLTLANNIIESQSKEIQAMQNWYKGWYK